MSATAADTFSIGVVIPIYNHPETIADLVDAIGQHQLPCLIVDDGSDDRTQAVLADLATRPGVQVHRLPQNQGKGAACRMGLRLLAKQGCTHALQLDADGQHDPADIPSFIAAARAHPQALVLGKPRYDHSVPRSRLIGRYATHIWVWIETMSLAIHDTMCGFRMYPLAATLPVLDSPLIGNRMDFDTSIVVRLYWQRVHVINLSTPVRYPADGISHFRLLRDNLRISWMHTCLVMAMLPRLPSLLVRPSQEVHYPPQDWLSVAERGSLLGMRFTLLLYRLLGYRICAAFMHLIVGYFWLTGRQARQHSRTYLRQLASTERGRAALGHAPGWRDTYRHLCEYGYAILDKFAAWMNDLERHHLEWDNYDEIKAVLQRRQGAILLGAHIGNPEVIRAMSVRLGTARVNALMIVHNAPRFNRLLREVDQRSDLRLIAVHEMDASLALELRERLEAGELVALMGDRITPGSNTRVFRLPFLGREAAIPQGPYILASLLDHPVYLLFVTRTGFRRYRVHMEKFADSLSMPRAGRLANLQAAAARFVGRMEEVCYRTPYQWFNFYDYWQ